MTEEQRLSMTNDERKAEEIKIAKKKKISVDDANFIWANYKDECKRKSSLPNKHTLLFRLNTTIDEYFTLLETDDRSLTASGNGKFVKWLKLTMMEMSGMIMSEASISKNNVLLNLNDKMFHADTFLWEAKQKNKLDIKKPSLASIIDVGEPIQRISLK